MGSISISRSNAKAPTQLAREIEGRRINLLLQRRRGTAAGEAVAVVEEVVAGKIQSVGSSGSLMACVYDGEG